MAGKNTNGEITMRNDNEPRLFWVVDSPEENEEIFTTREKAEQYAKRFGKKRPYTISIAEVRNYYFDEQLNDWNYDDHSDTFTKIITIVMQNDTRGQNERN